MKKLIIILCVLVFSTNLFAAKYELAIAVKDEADFGAHIKKKAGDIITIRQYPWNWGAIEIRTHLIVIIETNTTKTSQQLRTLMENSVYKDLITIGNPLITETEYFEIMESGERKPNEFEMVAKTRLTLALSKIKQELPDLNLVKVADKQVRYQPFKSKSQLIQKFNGLNGNRLVTINEVDCTSSSKISDEAEFSIDLDVIPLIILDNLTGNLIKL